MTIHPGKSTLMAVVAVVLLAGCGLCAEEQPQITPDKFLSMRMMRSPSGRFVAYGTNTLQVSDLVRWADGTAVCLERLLGVTPLQGRSPMRLVITVDPASTGGWVRVASASPALHIVVANYESVDIQTVGRKLVACMLADSSTWGATQRSDAVTAPDWLVAGVMRNMDAAVRESDYESVFAVWRDGRVPPLAECLAALVGDAATNAAMTGVLVHWMLSLKGKGACIRDVMSLASGGAVPRVDWFYSFAGCSVPADLDTAWEQWLVGRQWVIGAPGRKADWLVDRIRSERLIYPADSGIPNSNPDDLPLAMKDLIRERKAGWARSAASVRAVRMRMLAAGRDNAIVEVLNAYGIFLEAVSAGRGEAQLKALLEDADRRFAALEAGMAGGSTGTNSVPAAPVAEDGRTSQ